jgi:hypothetical protein
MAEIAGQEGHVVTVKDQAEHPMGKRNQSQHDTKGNISLVTATLAFGLPRDVTVSELEIECLFPAEKYSASILDDLV